jgi:PAS domain S-box-containing protein
VFTKADGLPSDFAPSITVGNANNVWVATSTGVAHIVGEKVAAFTPRNVSVLQGNPTVAQRMKDGQIWIGDKDGRIVSCRRKSSEPTKFEWSLVKEADSTPGTNLSAIYQSAAGRIWLAQGLGGLSCCEDGVWQPVRTNYRRVNDVMEDCHGKLWIVGSEGTSCWDGDAWQRQGGHAKCLAESSEGQLFIGGDRIAGFGNGAFKPFEFRAMFGRRAIQHIEFTATNGAWIGTKKGILQLVQPTWKDVPHTEKSARFEAHAFGANPQQMPLAVNSTDWLVKFDVERNEWDNLLKLPFESDSRQFLSMPLNGRLWILNADIAWQVQLEPPAVLRQIELPQALRGSKDPPTRLLATVQDKIYAYGGGGAFRLESTGWVRCAPDAASEPVVSMQTLKNGSSLLVGLRDRVERWCQGKKESSWTPPDVPDFHSLSFARETSDGRIILGTKGLGLYIMHGAKVTRLTVRDGLPSARIVCFWEATDGTFWFGAQHSGILSLRDGRWIHYSHDDGLPNSELVTLGEHPPGTIWAAYRNRAVLRYRPDKAPPETIIAAATAEIASGGEGVFSVRGFDVLNNTPVKDLQYSWRLTRKNSKEVVPWSAFAPQVTFTSNPLDAGVYRLQVRSQDRDRNIDPTPAEIQIVALASIWQRAEFIAPFFFLTCVAGLMGIKAYRSHQELRTHRDHLDEMVKQRTSQLLVANRTAEAERERLAATFNSIGDSLFATDREGYILLMNPVAESLVGQPECEARGKRFDDVVQLLDIDSRQVIEGPVADLLNKREAIPSQRMIALSASAHGECVLAINYSLILDHKGTTIGAVIVARDITEKRQLERERVKSSQLESLGVLAGGIAHDFNNLLVGILANVSSSQELNDLDSIRQRLREAEKACLRASSLTSQLLTFSKGGAPIRQSICIAAAIKDAAEISGQGSNVVLQFDLETDLWPVDADVQQISHVVKNLMNNACHSMPDGGEIKISANNVECDNGRSLPGLEGDRFICISIADQGIGIEQERLAGIFDPYYTTKAVGSGLGLAVCYSIVQQHNGLIQVHSELGSGSRFDVYLPASTQTSWVDESRDQGGADDTLPPKNILVMDDQQIVLESFQALLDSAGHHTFTACDSDEAVQVFSQAKEDGSPIDVVILDLTIPGGKGGKEVLKELLRLDPLVRSIVTSGYSDDPVMANYRDYGFHGRIPKPFPSRDLSRELQRVMETSNSCLPIERI